MGQNSTAVAAEVIDAFNDGDWNRPRKVVSDDIVYNEPGTGRRLVGIDPYLDGMEGWRKAFADVKGTIDEVVTDGSTVVQRLTWRGTHTGPLDTPNGTLPASGQTVEIVSTIWFHVEDGRVRDVHNHLDLLSLLSQIGALG